MSTESRWNQARDRRDMPMLTPIDTKPKKTPEQIRAEKRMALLTPTPYEMRKMKAKDKLIQTDMDIQWGFEMCDWYEQHSPKQLSELKKIVLEEIRFRNSKGVYPTTDELMANTDIMSRLMTQQFVIKSKVRKSMFKAEPEPVAVVKRRLERILLAFEHKGLVDVREWKGEKIWKA